MPREFSQESNGYEVGIKALQKEYARGAKNTRRSKADFQGFLERIDWCLSLYKREQRELLAAERGAAKPAKHAEHVAERGAARRSAEHATEKTKNGHHKKKARTNGAEA